MSLVLDRISEIATSEGHKMALSDGKRNVTYAQSNSLINAVANWLKQYPISSLGLYGDNTLEWVIVDLAALKNEIMVLPIPPFFTDEQVDHLLHSSEIISVVAASDEPKLAHFSERHTFDTDEFCFSLSRMVTHKSDVKQDLPLWPKATQKLTFTSGSTGQPKGACLSLTHIETTASSISSVVAPLKVNAHLCISPFATLLENIAGIYVPLLSGGLIHVRRMAEVGFHQMSQFDPSLFLKTLIQTQTESMILVPQLLLALVTLKENGFPVPSSFKFIAVGGGTVSEALLNRAQALDLPLFQGYGLSECGSVVTLNRLGANRLGSVGQCLPHAQIKISDAGEILIKGASMLGYLNEAPLNASAPNVNGPHLPWLATGDLGFIDEDGFVFINGRIKNLIITAFGRNLNPEWPEAKLTQKLAIQQAVLFGNGLTENVAIVVARKGYSAAAVKKAVSEVNQELPDYAKISRYQLAEEPFTSSNGLATANGRPKRQAIERKFHDSIYRMNNEEMTMPFYDTLQQATEQQRNNLMSAPVIQAVLDGRFDIESYRFFLAQAYHHVKHTVPLMMACGGRLTEEYEWVRQALLEYLNEEYGHQEWILNDIDACGGNASAVRHEEAGSAMELMVAYLYDTIYRNNPMGFFGMVLVLEGTSVQLASQLGKIIQTKLNLPSSAFSYLYSHGELDIGHLQFFKTLMNKVTNEADQKAIINSAKYCYQMYSDMLNSIPLLAHEDRATGVNQNAA